MNGKGIAADQQIEAELNDVAFNARQAYYEFARAAAALGVAKKTLEEATSQRTETAALVRAGAAPTVDALRTEAQVSAAEVAVAEAEFDLAVDSAVGRRIAKATLLRAIGDRP